MTIEMLFAFLTINEISYFFTMYLKDGCSDINQTRTPGNFVPETPVRMNDNMVDDASDRVT